MPATLPAPPALEGVTWRPAVPSDASAIVDLQDACFEVDDTYREVETEVLERWDDPDVHAPTDSIVAVEGDGTVKASVWCYVPSTAATKWRAFGDLSIHPDWRNDEIMGFALEWWEARAAQRLAEHHDSLSKVYWLGAYSHEEGKIRFLEAHGYEIRRYYDELTRDLAFPLPELRLPAGVELVHAEEAHPGDELKVHNESFADHWGSQPFSQERWDHFKNEFYLPGASYVAYDRDEPVGHVLCSKYPHDFDDRGFSHAWIESLGVVRSHRKRGIASALVTRSMGDFVTDGMEFAVLGVDSENPTGAYGIYEALGFVPDRRSVTLLKDLPS